MVEIEKSIKDILDELKEDVRSSKDLLIVAVDIGKISNCACFRKSDGKVLRRKFTFHNTAKGFEMILSKAGFYKNRNSCRDIIWGMEPSGYYWKHLYQFLVLNGKTAVTVSPLAVNRNRETIDVSKDKTDPKDAYNISDLITQGKFYLPVLRDKTVAQLHRFMHIYYRLTNAKSALRNRLRNVVGYVFPELEKYFKDVEAKTTLIILAGYPLPGMITALPRRSFVSYVSELNPRFSHRRIEEIYELAKTSVGITGEDDACLFEIESLLEELGAIRKRIDELNERVHQIVKDREDYQLLLTIPGIGPITAAGIIAEIGSIENFKSGKQLVKLAGLDLWGEESGKSIHTLRHITKRGRKSLRTMMYQAALGAIRSDSPLRDTYLKLLNNQPNRKKIKPKAMVAIASKLLRIVFRMLTQRIPYRSSYDSELRRRHLRRAA